MRREEKSKIPVIAGVFMIIAFILTILTASSFFFLDTSTIDIEEQQIGEEIDQGLIQGVTTACGVLILVFGLFLLIGGIFAIKRIHWGISLIGAILGIFSVGPWFLGSLLSIIALILLVISRDEFKSQGEEGTAVESTEAGQPPSAFLVEKEGARSCPTCGSPMLYDKEYDTWYCKNCQEYK